MKRFLLHTFLILLVIVLVNFVYLTIVGGNFRTYAQKYLKFRGDATFVVLGDSHANRAWSANQDPSIYNFAYGSDNVTDMRAKLEFISRTKPNGVKAVIISVEPHLISTYRETKNNNRINRIVNNGVIGTSTLVWFPLAVDPNTEIDSKIFVRSLLSNVGGLEKTSVREFSERKARARLRDQYGDGAASRRLFTEYQELIDYVRMQGWKVIALKYPVHPYFDSLVHASSEGRRLSSTMDSLVVTKELRVVDYSSVVNRPDWFMDQDHVNEEGSKEFLRSVKAQLTSYE
jgi:hypothetical protein